MALISYYNQEEYSSKIDLNNSPYTNRHTFEIEITPNAEDSLQLKNYLNNNTIITGIIDEIPEISYSVTWGDSPAAVLNDKIKKFTQNKWIKMFAQQNSNYRPPLLTDAWTQQFPKAAEPLNISFKFRAYPLDGYYNTTHFNNIIKLLVFVTTPQDFNLTDTIDYMDKAGQEMYNNGQKAYDIVKQLKNAASSDSINFSDIASIFAGTKKETEISSEEKDFIAALDNLESFIEGMMNMKDDNVGGCPLIKLGINGLIKKSSQVKWILKSWSFKPALQVTFDNNPIYVDFNITLQTQYVLSNKDLDEILY